MPGGRTGLSPTIGRHASNRASAVQRASVILALCLVIGAPILNWYRMSSAEIPRTLEGFTARLDRRVPTLMRAYSIPGVSIALVQGGQVTWTKAYGYADLAAGRPLTTDTVLMAQSISKSVTAWGVMKLVEKGRIELDGPVTRYVKRWRFPESEFPADKVTIRQLLSLSAGMPLGDFAASDTPGAATPPVQETLAKENARLVRAPGSAFSYSNMSYALLELLIEEVTGQAFPEYMETEVLVPLGMTDSSFAWRDEFRVRIATGYDLQGRPVPPYVYPYHASGGLFATLGDLARFVTAGMIRPEDSRGQGVLGAGSVGQLYDPVVKVPGMFGAVSEAYGLGHFLETLPSGHRAVWHGGQGNGWMTHFHSVPETGDGIVILTNSQRSWPFFSAVLGAWAKWSGHTSVGMGTIIRTEPGMQLLIALLMVASLWQMWRLGSGLMSGQRRFAPFLRKTRLLRLGAASLSALLTWVLVWSARQEYLFLFSIFPTLCGWLGAALLGVAIVALLSACLPHVDRGFRQ